LQWFGIIQQVENIQLIIFLIDLGIYSYIIDFLTEIIALLIFFAILLLVGSVGSHHYGEQLIKIFDYILSAVPGLGTIYKSFRRMGDVMIGTGEKNFQEVKLVECFGDEIFLIGFKTSESLSAVEKSTGREEMVSMFLPLAPNPVTGGFLTYVPEENLYDIDMSVEEAVRSILTSGVATSTNEEQRPITLDQLQDVTDLNRDMSSDTAENDS